jgi:formylglycine-generating enzyme required for sulfatase activity
MINKNIFGGICCMVLAVGITLSAEVRAADKPVDDGMVLIPAGEFKMGSDKEENLAMWRGANDLNPYGFNDRLYVDERPMHKVTLPAFLIDKYEVTNAQYREFVIITRYRIPFSWAQNGYSISNDYLSYLPLKELRQIATDKFKLDMDVTTMTQKALLTELQKINAARDSMPVTAVTWFDAGNFCKWSRKRLPTEAEWEKAARGPQGFEYPWGNEWDAKKISTMSEDDEAPYSPIGSYPGDVSAYGVNDMAANVSEWVDDWYDAYPGESTSGSRFFGKTQRVVRGGMASSGHYDSLSVVFRAAKRNHLFPSTALIDLGFRCAKDAK